MDLLQIATGITKCDDYYKLRQYSGAFEDCPVSGNIYKLCASNHLHHLLGVDDDRIFCYFINSLHIFAESILVLKSRLLTKVTINLIRSAVSNDDGRVFCA